MKRKVVKGSAIVHLIANNAIEDYELLDFDFPDENVLLIEDED